MEAHGARPGARTALDGVGGVGETLPSFALASVLYLTDTPEEAGAFVSAAPLLSASQKVTQEMLRRLACLVSTREWTAGSKACRPMWTARSPGPKKTCWPWAPSPCRATLATYAPDLSDCFCWV